MQIFIFEIFIESEKSNDHPGRVEGRLTVEAQISTNGTIIPLDSFRSLLPRVAIAYLSTLLMPLGVFC